MQRFLETTDGYSIQQANSRIAQRCLDTYLCGEFDGDDLLAYSTRYWPAHVEQLNSCQRLSIKESVIKFFTEEEHFEDWLECLDTREIETGANWSNPLERKLEECFSSPPSAIFAASSFGLVELLECSELADEFDLNQVNKNGTSGLYLAARRGHSKVVRKLLQLGASVDAPGNQYGNAIQAACFGGHDEIVKILLEEGVSCSSTVKSEYSSPLQAALATGHVHVAQTLIDAGTQLATQEQFDDAMKSASFNGNVEIVGQLLAGKAGNFTPQIKPDSLQVALSGSQRRKARALLRRCADINESTGYFGNALAAAIASRKLELVKLVVDVGAKTDLRGRFGYPLRAAAVVNSLDICRYLLDKGSDPNAEDTELGDPLQAAAASGNLELIILLLDHGASVDGKGGHFGNTLQAAAFHGNEQAVKLLIERGAAVSEPWDHKPSGRYRDALQAAVYAGHENIVEVLLAAGARLNPGRVGRVYPHSSFIRSERMALPDSRLDAKNFDTPSELGPLEIAARHGNLTLVKILLDKGANLDVKDADYRDIEYNDGCAYTALQIACFWGHQGVAELLLDRGADINAVRQTLGTPLQAALESSHFELANMLLLRGAEIDQHWEFFGSCLQVFSERGDIEVVKFLSERGANIEDPGGEHGNALQVACHAGRIEVVQFLLSCGADVKAPGKEVGDALRAASSSGNLEIIKMLLQQGIGVDDVTGNQVTALCIAAANGHEAAVRLLLEQGALVDGNCVPEGKTSEADGGKVSEGFCGSTPLHLAAYHGHESIVTILLEKGADVHLKSKSAFPSRFNGFGFFIDCDSRMRRAGNKRECPALFAASFWGHASSASLLFECDPLGYVSHGTFASIIEVSLNRGHTNIASILLQGAIFRQFKRNQIDGAFKYACESGHDEFVQDSLNHFQLSNWPDALLWAAEKGRESVVNVLLQNGANINHRGKEGKTAIEITISIINRHEHPFCLENKPPSWINVLETLLLAGAEIDDFTGKIKEVISDIARKCSVHCWKTLYLRGFGLFDDLEFASKALILAAEVADVDKALYLGTKQIFPCKVIKSAILAAINSRKQTVPVIKAILSLKPPLCSDEESTTNCDENLDKDLLVSASYNGDIETAAMLIQHFGYGTAAIEAALKAAIRKGHVPCTDFLLNSQEWSPAQKSAILPRFIPVCFPSSSKAMIDYLFREGLSPNSRHPQSGFTILYTAAKEGDEHGVTTVIDHGADINIGGEYGTALHAAAVAGNWEAIEILLSSGADVDAPCAKFGTPLSALVEQKWEKYCYRVNYKSSCLRECHQCSARLLLDWGADINASHGDSPVETPLQKAERTGNKIAIGMFSE